MKLRLNALLGSLLIGFVALTALTATLWTPHPVTRINLRARLRAPDATYWLGADEFGRDVLSRLMAAAVTSVTVALATVAAALVIGVTIGLVSGFSVAGPTVS